MLQPICHWVCFDCRKQFRRWARLDPSEPDGLETGVAPVACPECGRPMIDMGKCFRPPRRRDRRTWAQLRCLAEHGYRFWRASTHSWIRYLTRCSAGKLKAEVIIAHCACRYAPPGKVLLRAIAERHPWV